MAAAIARMRWATRMVTPSKVRPPWASRSSWPLRVSLTDSISWRTDLSNGSPWRAAWSVRAGRSKVVPRAARPASVARPAKPLSVIRIRPGRLVVSWGSTSSMAVSTYSYPISGDPAGSQAGFGGPAGEAFVSDQDQAGPAGGELGLDIKHGGQHLTLTDLGVGQRPQDGHPGRGADQVQPQPPEPAGMARAVPVVRPSGHVRAPGGGPRAAAFHRGGIGDPDVVEPEVAVDGQIPDRLLDQRQRSAQ